MLQVEQATKAGSVPAKIGLFFVIQRYSKKVC